MTSYATFLTLTLLLRLCRTWASFGIHAFSPSFTHTHLYQAFCYPVPSTQLSIPSPANSAAVVYCRQMGWVGPQLVVLAFPGFSVCINLAALPCLQQVCSVITNQLFSSFLCDTPIGIQRKRCWTPQLYMVFLVLSQLVPSLSTHPDCLTIRFTFCGLS